MTRHPDISWKLSHYIHDRLQSLIQKAPGGATAKSVARRPATKKEIINYPSVFWH
jgi:hypothetical protein